MYGVFSTKGIKAGETIYKFVPKYIANPTQTSIQYNGKHFEDNIGQYLNHHCNPSTGIFVKNQSIILNALRKICKNEEITFDYNKTEDYITHPFKCKCHNKLIKGKKFAIK